jgi:hypothetical protein
MNYKQFYQKSIEDPEVFWKEQAEQIEWFKFPDTILSKDANGLFQWYKGGQLNTSYLALDHQIENGRGDQAALIYDSPVTNTKKSLYLPAITG